MRSGGCGEGPVAVEAEKLWIFMDHYSWVHPYDETGNRRTFDDIPTAFENFGTTPTAVSPARFGMQAALPSLTRHISSSFGPITFGGLFRNSFSKKIRRRRWPRRWRWRDLRRIDFYPAGLGTVERPPCAALRGEGEMDRFHRRAALVNSPHPAC